MTNTESITAVVTVGLSPAEAFRAFTEDVGAWFRLAPASFPVPVSTVEFDTGDQPRFVAIPTDGSEPLEIASITTWDPSRRLVFSDGDTEVEVRFEPTEGVTQVTLVHRGLASLDDGEMDRTYRYGPRLLPGWFEQYVEPDLSLPVGIVAGVMYRDVGAASDWLVEHLGFEVRGLFADADGRINNAELRVGATEVWLFENQAIPEPTEGLPRQWIGVWVDDVDAAHQRVAASGIRATEPEDANYGVRSFNVTGPEGVMWGFLRRIDNEIGTSLLA
ncbi:MAG: SRPBCC domain-containing protein [Acidimicrobiia bacterium]|nr:SRPBCC domain-containing protein [Acidimicrobiia bacterium]